MGFLVFCLPASLVFPLKALWTHSPDYSLQSNLAFVMQQDHTVSPFSSHIKAVFVLSLVFKTLWGWFLTSMQLYVCTAHTILFRPVAHLSLCPWHSYFYPISLAVTAPSSCISKWFFLTFKNLIHFSRTNSSNCVFRKHLGELEAKLIPPLSEFP